MMAAARRARGHARIGPGDVEMEIRGGVHGDRATAAMVVNSIPRVISARPGVLTMDDIPISYK